MNADLGTQWEQAFAELGLTPPPGELGRVLAAYAEPQRAYHTGVHLEECLALFEEVRALAQRPASGDSAVADRQGCAEPSACATAYRDAVAGGPDVGDAAGRSCALRFRVRAAGRVVDLALTTPRARSTPRGACRSRWRPARRP